ncbi:hypothetical protein LIER_40564 [Lithospermum erythrorhizon]|uniref:Helitron helicase-like domain-containing protein n=1 Tax=Lithospermum erythrorhizon TaxID=34254 RepID=A0AAV3R0L1_LITER
MELCPYSKFLRSLSIMGDLDRYCIVIKSDSTLYQLVFNKPTSVEVSGIWIEAEDNPPGQTYMRDIRVYARSGHSHHIQPYYACYDRLQYVLMFPGGEPGSHGHQRATKRYKQGCMCDNPGVFHINKRSTVSCRQYYAYKLQRRVIDTYYLVRFRRLLQQYIKIESMKLSYLSNNQKTLRVDYYKGVVDCVVSGVQKGGYVGTRVYMPPSFIGGPRDMHHRYLDSMSLV